VNAPSPPPGLGPGEVAGSETGDLAPLRRLLLVLADSKRILGIRYSDWLLGAPSLEAGIAAASMAQDEWGHARLLYAMLRDVGMDPMEVEHQREAGEYCSVQALDEPLPDWAAFVAAVVVVDGALSVLLRALEEGEYEPARGRIGKMLAEEAFHRDLGRGWFRRLAVGSPEARTRLLEEVDRLLPSTVRSLAPDDGAGDRLAMSGMLPLPAELRRRLAEELDPVLAGVHRTVPLEEKAGSDWDPARGRGSGGPDAETLERARGDRNRLLFVE